MMRHAGKQRGAPTRQRRRLRCDTRVHCEVPPRGSGGGDDAPRESAARCTHAAAAAAAMRHTSAQRGAPTRQRRRRRCDTQEHSGVPSRGSSGGGGTRHSGCSSNQADGMHRANLNERYSEAAATHSASRESDWRACDHRRTHRSGNPVDGRHRARAPGATPRANANARSQLSNAAAVETPRQRCPLRGGWQCDEANCHPDPVD